VRCPDITEGDLIMGEANKTAIATLVERATRYTMLVHLPDGHDAAAVRDGLIATIATLPAHLRGSLTWDQGAEMARHKQFSMATDLAVYFCDPASPWQRGTNEYTNGLLRQYFPKGSDLSVFAGPLRAGPHRGGRALVDADTEPGEDHLASLGRRAGPRSIVPPVSIDEAAGR
jgi:hypothetical protein